jgi:integrase
LTWRTWTWPNRRAKVRRKGGAVDVIVGQTGTARLLPRLLKGRKSGPVFVTERKARVHLAAADLDEHGHARLSYQEAAALFSKASGWATLRQLRHSALTHDAEAGTGTPMLMARSGHTCVRSLPSTRGYFPASCPSGACSFVANVHGRQPRRR